MRPQQPPVPVRQKATATTARPGESPGGPLLSRGLVTFEKVGIGWNQASRNSDSYSGSSKGGQRWALWRPLLLAISSCYLCYPEMVEHILNKIQEGGYTMWAAALCSVASSSFEPKLSRTSDMKLLSMALGKVIERLLEQGKPRTGLVNNCFMLLPEVTVKLKEVQEGIEDEDVGEDEDDNYSGDEDSEDEDDEDSESEDDEIEETQKEFLERYARVAAELENGLNVEEEDVEDQDYEPELGFLEGVDTTRAIFSLIERYHNVLIKDQVLPSELVSNIIKSFPEHSSLFSPSR